MDPTTAALVASLVVSGIVNILQAVKHTFKKCGSIEFKDNTPPGSVPSSVSGRELQLQLPMVTQPNDQPKEQRSHQSIHISQV